MFRRKIKACIWCYSPTIFFSRSCQKDFPYFVKSICRSCQKDLPISWGLFSLMPIYSRRRPTCLSFWSSFFWSLTQHYWVGSISFQSQFPTGKRSSSSSSSLWYASSSLLSSLSSTLSSSFQSTFHCRIKSSSELRRWKNRKHFQEHEFWIHFPWSRTTLLKEKTEYIYGTSRRKCLFIDLFLS